MPANSRGAAPTTARIPNSRKRPLAEYASRLYIPAAIRIAASAAKAAISVTAKRRRTCDSLS